MEEKLLSNKSNLQYITLRALPGMLRRDVAHGVDVGIQIETLQVFAPQLRQFRSFSVRSNNVDILKLFSSSANVEEMYPVTLPLQKKKEEKSQGKKS